MSECVEKLSHSCGSSDALQVFLDDRDRYTGYCFACDTYVPDPYGADVDRIVPRKKFKKSAEKILEEINFISQLRTVDLPDRKLTKEALSYFGVKIGLSEQDGSTPIFHYYPYYNNNRLITYKVRLVEGKNFWTVGDIKEAELFGWKQALETGAKTIFITEGELDAVALYQALKNKNKGTKFADFNPAVVSLINGVASAKKCLSKFLPLISSNFKEVVIVLDQDRAGQGAVQDLMQVIPWAKMVTLPAKDPNECVIKGYELALCNAVLFKSSRPKNTRLIWGREVIDQGRQEAKMGLAWPWEELTKLTRGLRFGETIYIGAGVKMGKTTVVATLIADLITTHGLKVFCVQPEETKAKTFKLVVGKVAKRVFHDPEIPFDYDAYDKAAPIVGENLCLLDLYQSLDWHTLRGDVTAAVNEGCRAVFIDPITNLTNLVDSAQANTVLQEFSQELAYMAKDLNIMVFLFCHLKAPAAGSPHERGGAVYSSQFAGSRAMMRSCHMMLGLEGNKDPDLPPEEQNMRRLVILEDREYGATGYVSLFYDSNTGLLNEMKGV